MTQFDFLRKRLGLAVVTGCLAFIATFNIPSANATELPDFPVPFDWNGIYIGGNVGSSWNNYDFGGYRSKVDITEQFFAFEGPLLAPSENPARRPQEPQIGDTFLSFITDGGSHGGGGSDLSITGGAQIGYNKQFGHFVFGTEGSFNGTAPRSDWTKAQTTGAAPFFFDGVSADTLFTSMRKAQTNWNGAAVGKLGVAFGPFLFYGLGGVSFTDVTAFAQDTANTDFFGFNDGTNGRIGFIGSRADHFSAEDEAVLVGWTAGGGAELAVTKICSMGFEYRHIDAGNHNFHFASNQGPVFPGNTTISTDSDQITFRVNFYLGHLGH